MALTADPFQRVVAKEKPIELTGNMKQGLSGAMFRVALRFEQGAHHLPAFLKRRFSLNRRIVASADLLPIHNPRFCDSKKSVFIRVHPWLNSGA
jgi:hypothetical protein